MFEQLAQRSAYEAQVAANKLAFAPMVFHAALVARDRGLLDAIMNSESGLSVADVADQAGMSSYGCRVLLEACLASGIVAADDDRFCLTKMGWFVLSDEMTRVNMDFVRDVCYRGVTHLDTAIETGQPAGLREFGEWPTIYQGLADLPGKTRESWLRFDHFYSSAAFPKALETVLADAPRRLLDIGGNTGKFAIACLDKAPQVQVAVADLPGQLALLQERLPTEARARIELCPVDLLDSERPLPTGFDAIWMSQLLVCFSPDQIVDLLRRVAETMDRGSSLYVLDTFWDRQPQDIHAYCLLATSLYFTCMANGTSRVYRSDEMIELIRASGLVVDREIDGLGISHTLLVCHRGR